jgi:predicted dinucleotide-binding enzyme
MRRVLVLGGYGAFGARVAERLTRAGDIEVIVAGRSEQKARDLAGRLAGRTGGKVAGLRLDATAIAASDLGPIRPAVIVNASGPYQGQGYGLAKACIAAGVHYVDLADTRAFVTGIASLDEAARAAGVLVTSGASSVPAVSGAVLDACAPHLAVLESATIVVAPGNSFEPGRATAQSILSGLGQRIGGWGNTPSGGHGWQGLRRVRMPGLGGRWLGLVDTPDLDLFPRRYSGLRRVRVYAALEVGAFHLGVWGLSWLARWRLLRDPARLAGPLLAMHRRLTFLGSDRGGMTVALEGADHAGSPKRIQWHLIAGSGHGPYVPATPAVLVAKRLLAGTLAARGAMPCLGLFTLADFLAEVADLDIASGIDGAAGAS